MTEMLIDNVGLSTAYVGIRIGVPVSYGYCTGFYIQIGIWVKPKPELHMHLLKSKKKAKSFLKKQHKPY